MLLEEDLRQADDVLCLHAVKTDRLNVFFQPGNAELHDFLWSNREELSSGEVHRFVGGLRREHHRDQKLERAAVLELGGGIRIRFAEPAEDLRALLQVHRRRRERISARTRLRSAGAVL